ncbi:MAG: heme lyase CcmF/NrfE family subunit [Magnetococcales bacterium]|nr:heme lyase CcmF/NrfE family subunit [Magnetococcales bacterium]
MPIEVIEWGHFAAVMALLLAAVQSLTAAWGGWYQQVVWVDVSRRAVWAVWLLLSVAMASLVVAFLQHDFSVRYVAEHSSRALPLFYLATALWGGHEGSLLLWAWLLALFAALAVWRHGSLRSPTLPLPSLAALLAILGAVVVGFLLLILFLSSPFQRLWPPPTDGRDLNPLLQDPGMVFHPPFLYLGYVGFAVPYALAMATLLTGRLYDDWVVTCRRWILFAWAMLTTGIVFGAYWAYYELGWGGYWAWDPVENASFMPWLTSTALLHSMMVQQRRHIFRTWNLFLIITTFALALLGTFLVRSGVLSSVHAFATDPGRGVYLLVFMAVVLLGSFGILTLRSDRLQATVRLPSMVCRESTFLFNNLFFVAAAATVLLGTLYPLAIETLSDSKVSVGAPYFNKVFVPIMLAVLLLMGLGPSIPWRHASLAQLRRYFLIPALVAIGVVPLIWWGLAIHNGYGVIAAAIVLFVVMSHGGDIMRAYWRSTDRQFMRLVLRNKRRYGGLLTHFGLLILVSGLVGSGLFKQERDLVMRPGDTTHIGAWQLTFEAIGQRSQHNWQADEGRFSAQRSGGGASVTLQPQKRIYQRSPQPTTEAAIYSSWREDLYLVLGDPAGDDGAWTIRIYLNPLVVWIWWGAGVMILGVGLSLLDQPRQRLVEN